MQNKYKQIKQRSSGVLLPIPSLPSKYGIGQLGKCAYEFIDFLSSAKQSYWQVLPTVPTGYGDSPYQSCCSIAGSEYFIDIDMLITARLLKVSEVASILTLTDSRIKYENLFYSRYDLLKLAFSRYKGSAKFTAFVRRGQFADYALFRSLSEYHGFISWTAWEAKYRDRDRKALESFASEHSSSIMFWQWCQFIYAEQWAKLRKYAAAKGVGIIGDMPIYVAYDSVECWSDRSLFQFGAKCELSAVAGCPPDYFSADGQLWGNPLYNWDAMRADDYMWWQQRLEYSLSQFDIVRIDHFRGFDRYFSIPFGSENARGGEWKQGPSAEMFKLLEERMGSMPLIAEDLGTLDESAIDMFDKVGYPGMKILQYAFDGDSNLYLPHNYASDNCVVYAGTHDNDTLVGYIRELGNDARGRLFEGVVRECERLGMSSTPCSDIELASEIIKLGYESGAMLVITQLQDLMFIGSEGRINKPSTLSLDNWSYRVSDDYASEELIARLRELTVSADRD